MSGEEEEDEEEEEYSGEESTPKKKKTDTKKPIKTTSTKKAEEGGDIKLEARGSQELLSDWKKGDLAIVWLENTGKPAAYFNIIDIQRRPDLIGQVEEYDADNERPHKVYLDSGGVIVCTPHFLSHIQILYK